MLESFRVHRGRWPVATSLHDVNNNVADGRFFKSGGEIFEGQGEISTRLLS